ncbi:hypothetical protein ACFE04_016282 [Oxalis oulophora]
MMMMMSRVRPYPFLIYHHYHHFLSIFYGGAAVEILLASLTHSRRWVSIWIPAEFHFSVAGIESVLSYKNFCCKIVKNWSRDVRVVESVDQKVYIPARLEKLGHPYGYPG